MLDVIKVIILGIVEGITLPVRSAEINTDSSLLIMVTCLSVIIPLIPQVSLRRASCVCKTEYSLLIQTVPAGYGVDP